MKPYVGRRRVQQLGGSKVIVIPSEWADAHNIKAGDELTLVANRHLKVLAPEDVKDIYDPVTEVVAEEK